MEGIDFIFWNWTVAVYLFVAGVSAGAFAVSGFAYLLGKEKYQYIARIGAYIAPFPLIFGLICLIYDLERPYLFWKLLVTFQAYSVMSLGSWLLVIFSTLSFVYFYLWLPDRFDVMALLRLIPKSWEKLVIVRAFKTNPLFRMLSRAGLNKLKGLVGMAGILVALLVGIYTGILLGVVSARPFWNNPVLPILFLVSALKTGTSSICLIGYFFGGFGEKNLEKIEANKKVIHVIDFVLMVLSIIAILLFVFGLYSSPRSSEEAVGLIMGGQFTFLFWGLVVVVGTLFPFALELYEMIHRAGKDATPARHSPWISGLVTLSVLAGGLILRYVVVYAGQVTKVAGS
jgi:formate-dependent nitrite reductase membrane component NrfD